MFFFAATLQLQLATMAQKSERNCLSAKVDSWLLSARALDK